jgi:acetyl-CoA acyltransferase
MATAKIQSGMAHCIIAGESMSFIPMEGTNQPDYAKAGNEDYYWGMGLTGSSSSNNLKFQENQEFAYNSHLKALKAQAEGKFDKQIVPITVEHIFNENGKRN